MKRKLVSMLLAVSMIFTLLPAQAFAAGASAPVDTANPFEDVRQGSWYYDAVQYVRVNGLFYGAGKTTFLPEGAMTRGMFVTVLGRMAGVNPDNYAGPSAFTDVPGNAYYAPYVAWAVKYGVTTGTGNGKFSPDAYINRQEMAVFLVRYFETFDVDYGANAGTAAVPADIDSVSPWARDAVLKLWRTGLFAGNGETFDPFGSATRAQAAMVCCRTDETVAVWYSEPGTASTRVRIDPATGRPYDNGDTPSGPSTPSESSDPSTPSTPSEPSGGSFDGSGAFGGGSGGTTTTTYYEVRFALGSGVDSTGVTLPNTAAYTENTPVTSLPTPTVQNGTFLGWYYDAAMTQAVGSGDVVSRNMTLYAKIGTSGSNPERAPLPVRDEPNYITNADAPTDFILKLSGSYQPGDMTITDVTAGNAQVGFTVGTDGTVSITGIAGDADSFRQLTGWEAGHTYKVELTEASQAVFDYNGPQAPSVRVFNIVTAKNEVQNLRVDEGMKFIPREQVSGMSETMAGLFSLSVEDGGQSRSQENNHIGTFTYTGDLNVGDTAAIYEGTDPRQRGLADIEGNIVYATITEKNGNTYTYRTADAENVLFTPDILPVSSGADKVADDGYTLTVDANVFDFRDGALADMGLDAATTVDVGDFVALYTGESVQTAASVTYGEIKTVRLDVLDNTDVYVIGYAPVSEDAVLASMDLYHTENREITLTDEEIAQIEQDMAAQAARSGFIDEAAEYLTALALETGGFQELADGFDLESFTMTYAGGAPVSRQERSVLSYSSGRAGSRVNITKQEVKPHVKVGELDHFEEGRGVTVELEMTLEVEVDTGGGNKINITLQAVFEQEILLNVNTSGGAVWKKAWIFPYIADYQMTANIDLGTYTGVGVTATVKTAGAEEEAFNWENVTGSTGEQTILNIGRQIEQLMKDKDKFLNYDLVGGDDGDDGDDDGGIPIDGGLPEKYAAMIEDADDSWIELFRVKIFEQEKSVDPYHILAYKIGAHFVASANLYVTLGLTFDYAVAKRYSFSLTLFSRKCTNNTVDLEPAHYEFMFYAMGTMGLRAGVEFEIAIGLFSTKLDSVGICAEAGAYAQMWGYFYYQLKWETGQSKQSNYGGAMYIDIGAYLKISFKAQAFSSKKLTWKPTIYEHEWPIYSAGEQENVLDFVLEEDADDLYIDMIAETSATLPTSVLTMKYLDMKSGELGGEENVPGKIYDDGTESRFDIAFSGRDAGCFQYDAAANTITAIPGERGALEANMTITWLGCKLSFHNQPIRRTVQLTYVSPDANYIVFDSNGGSRAAGVQGNAGVDEIIWPDDPTKVGYDFGGWYTDNGTFANAFDPGPLRTEQREVIVKGKPVTKTVTVTTMPDAGRFPSGQKGLTLYARWIPRTDTRYAVESWLEQINGTYRRIYRDELRGTTDAVITIQRKTGEYNGVPGYLDHFDAAYDTSTTIAPDGSTVLRVNYNRRSYTHTFTYGGHAQGNSSIVFTIPYEGSVYAPAMALPGYTFTGFDGYDENVTSQQDATYEAQWEARTDIPYRVVHYCQRATGNGYLLASDAVQNLYGQTGSPIPLDSLKRTEAGMTFAGARVKGEPAANPTIAGDGSTIVELYYDRQTAVLTWNANGGKFADATTAMTTTGRYGTRIIAPAAPSNGNRQFLGWFTDAACTMPLAADATVGGAQTFYAKWEREQLPEGTFTITYNGMDYVSGYPNANTYKTTYTAKDEVRLPSSISRQGATFLGWTGTDLTEPTLVVTIPRGSTGDRVYTANWTVHTYAITYTAGDKNPNGGISLQNKINLTGLSPSSYTFADVADGPLPLPDASLIDGADYGKPGYTVKGWYADEACTKPITEIKKPLGYQHPESKTVYGQWELAPTKAAYSVLGDNENLTKEAIEANLFDGAALPEELTANMTFPTLNSDYNFIGWYYEGKDGKFYALQALNGGAYFNPIHDSNTLPDFIEKAQPTNGVYILYLACAKKNISTAAGLKRLSDVCSLTNWGCTVTGDYTLANDITLSEMDVAAWTPFLYKGGTFEGNGHRIIYSVSDTTQIPPVFHRISNTGIVQNLNIQFPAAAQIKPRTITGLEGMENKALCWGGVTYELGAGGQIINCHVGGGNLSYTCGDPTVQACVGGIAGYAYGGASPGSKIQNCTVGDSAGSPLNVTVTGCSTDSYLRTILGFGGRSTAADKNIRISYVIGSDATAEYRLWSNLGAGQQGATVSNIFCGTKYTINTYGPGVSKGANVTLYFNDTAQ